jgi:hypothetical protein
MCKIAAGSDFVVITEDEKQWLLDFGDEGFTIKPL